MAYNTGFGSANEVLGGSRFVELTAGPCGKAFHEVDTTPFRIPDRLPNPVSPWYESPPVSPLIDLGVSISPMERRPERPIPYPAINLEPFYVRPGLIERLARKGLLRFSDDY